MSRTYGSESKSSAWVVPSSCSCSAVSSYGMCPAMLAITTPAPPEATILPNSSTTKATPTRSTAKMAAVGDCAGESPAVCAT
ncbi:Uncharacterised protein [Mycobacteroides abscessus]|nr:Uncharacterised protein [Mycobacteroides abscessus]